MTLREALFAAATAIALIAVIHGIYLLSAEAAWISGGVGFAVWAWLVLGGDE